MFPFTKEEELKLKTEVKTFEETNKAESLIQKLLRKFVSRNEAAKVDCWVIDISKGRVRLQVTKPATMNLDHFRTIWEGRGFKVEDIFGQIYGRKELSLPIGLSQEKLAEEIKKILAGCMK